MTENDIYSFEQEESIDFKKIINKVTAHWYLFFIIPFLSVVVGVIYVKMHNPIYKTDSTIIVDEEDNSMGLGKMFEGMDFMNGKNNIDNKLAILKSYYINEAAIKGLNLDVTYFGQKGLRKSDLYKSTPFRVKLNKNKYQLYNVPFTIKFDNSVYTVSVDEKVTDNKLGLQDSEVVFTEKSELNSSIKNKYIDFSVELTDFPLDEEVEYSFVLNREHDLVKFYKKNINVGLTAKKSSVISLSYKDAVPQRAVDYLNAVSSEMIQYGLIEKNQTALSSIKFIDQQLKGVVDSLAIAEGDLLKFKSENKVIDISSEGELLFKRVETLMEQKAQIERTLNYYEYLENYVNSKRDVGDVVSPATMGVGDNVLAELTKQLTFLSNEKSEKIVSAREGNPALVMINNRIENLKASIRENLKGQVTIVKDEEKQLDKQITRVESELNKLPGRESALLNIKRKYVLNNELYTFLLQKRAETGITLASTVSDTKILDRAKLESALIVSFGNKIILLIAFIIGLIIPAVYLFIREFLYNKIEDIEELEKKLNVPIVASVGKNYYDHNLVVSRHPNSSITESFRVLRANLNYLSTVDGCRTILITSTVPGEGKSFVSSNTAAVLAMAKKKTLLIGLDLRKPVLHHTFDTNENMGLSTYLINRDEYKDVILKTEVPNLDIVPSGPIPPNPSELIDSPRMREFIEKAREEYDYIILDTPPIGLVGDVLTLSKFADVYAHIVRNKYSQTDVIKFINSLEERHNIKNINVIFNGVKNKGLYGNSHYGYGNEYYADGKMSLGQRIKEKLFG